MIGLQSIDITMSSLGKPMFFDSMDELETKAKELLSSGKAQKVVLIHLVLPDGFYSRFMDIG